MPDLVPPELRDPIPEQAFVRPMATSARDALRRFSNHSHPSFTQSTRSLAYANTPAAPSIATSRVPSARPSLALQTTNLDRDDFDDVMDIVVDTGIPITYETNDAVKVKRVKSKTFVGNLFRGFRKIPQVLRPEWRPRKETVTTDVTHYTDPVYMSTPSTPIAPPAGTARYRQRGQSHLSQYDIPPSLQPADGYRSRNPSFQVYPPSVDADDVEQHEDNHSRIDPTVVSFPEPTLPDQTNYTADGTAFPVPSSPPASRSFVSERFDNMTLHPPRPTSTRPTSTRPTSTRATSTRPTSTRPASSQPDDDDDDPVSFQAHPLPSEDYRRMSKTYTGTKNSSTTMSTSEPSFSSERNGIINFFSTLRSMPWVSSGRVTTDYRPGLSHGSWAWKRVSVYSSGRSSSIFQSFAGTRPRKRSHGNRRKRFSFRPVQKSFASWYTDKGGKSAAGYQEGGALPNWMNPSGYKEDVIDLLSSGGGSASRSGTRSSILSGSERTGISSPPITPISPPSYYRRRSRREEPIHSTPHMRDRIRSLPRTEPRRGEQRHSDRPSRHRSDRREPRRHRRSPAMRPSTPYPTSYSYVPSPERPSSPVAPVPVVVPQTSMYFFQPPGVNSTPADMGHSDAPSPTHTIHPSASFPLVYMPFINSQMLQPGVRLASVSEVSEGTPPGFAGRGAFGGSPPPSVSPPGGYS